MPATALNTVRILVKCICIIRSLDEAKRNPGIARRCCTCASDAPAQEIPRISIRATGWSTRNRQPPIPATALDMVRILVKCIRSIRSLDEAKRNPGDSRRC